MKGADAFVGVSKPNLVTPDMVGSMAEKPILFLKIYPAKAVRDKLNSAHYFVGVLAFYAKRDSIHPAKFLKQAAFSLSLTALAG